MRLCHEMARSRYRWYIRLTVAKLFKIFQEIDYGENTEFN